MPDRSPDSAPPPSHPDDAADPDWFREPNAKEHWIAARLFIGFGLFFAALFFVQRGWWFRWIVLALGIYSILLGVRHARSARRG